MENNENIEKVEKDVQTKVKLNLLKNEINKELSQKYGIKVETADKLRELKLQTNQVQRENFEEYLKNETNFNSKEKEQILSLSKQNLDELYNSILGAEKLLSDENLENIELILQTKDGFSKKLFPEIYENVQDPNSIKDHILGFGLGSLDSFVSTTKLIYDLGAGVIKTPKHIYLIISDKGQYKDISRRLFIIYAVLTVLLIGGVIIYLVK